MCTRLKNGVLPNGQQPVSAGNNFFDYSNFEGMKSLSGWDAARSDEHQFHAKIMVSYRRLTSGRNKEFLLTHTLRLAVFRVAFGQFYESC